MKLFLMGLESKDELIILATRIEQRGHEVVNTDMLAKLLRNHETISQSVLFESSLEKLKEANLIVCFGKSMLPQEAFMLGYSAVRQDTRIILLNTSLTGITLSHVYARSCNSLDDAMRVLSLYGV